MVFVSLYRLYDSYVWLDQKETETETVLTLAMENEHQMHLSISVSCFLSLLFKLLEVHPNWVLNAN